MAIRGRRGCVCRCDVVIPLFFARRRPSDDEMTLDPSLCVTAAATTSWYCVYRCASSPQRRFEDRPSELFSRSCNSEDGTINTAGGWVKGMDAMAYGVGCGWGADDEGMKAFW